jgi:MarR family transcriptional regulator, organic hydroperoxide resistance regulator
MKPEETVDYNIKVAWHAISRMYGQQAAHIDITTSIGFVLLNIDPTIGTPTTKIAPLLGLEARSLTRLLKSMESKGLIYRVPDEVDRRSVRIRLTDLGLERREISRQTVRQFNHVVQRAIAPADLQTFFNVTRLITELVERKEIFPPDYQPSGEL